MDCAPVRVLIRAEAKFFVSRAFISAKNTCESTNIKCRTLNVAATGFRENFFFAKIFSETGPGFPISATAVLRISIGFKADPPTADPAPDPGC
jgi:hypothetical protein